MCSKPCLQVQMIRKQVPAGTRLFPTCTCAVYGLTVIAQISVFGSISGSRCGSTDKSVVQQLSLMLAANSGSISSIRISFVLVASCSGCTIPRLVGVCRISVVVTRYLLVYNTQKARYITIGVIQVTISMIPFLVLCP